MDFQGKLLQTQGFVSSFAGFLFGLFTGSSRLVALDDCPATQPRSFNSIISSNCALVATAILDDFGLLCAPEKKQKIVPGWEIVSPQKMDSEPGMWCAFFELYSPITALFCSSPCRMKHRPTDISKGNPLPGITWESEENQHTAIGPLNFPLPQGFLAPSRATSIPYQLTLRRPCVRPPAMWRATLWTGRHIVMWMCDHPNWNHWGLADAWQFFTWHYGHDLWNLGRAFCRNTKN